ncbi:amino acid permease fragment 1 [Helicobacter acinonychis str. Sheeba]|uniref:Amino acid permease 1 n=1 Tax=Helicobacter acinonychis (strain Sheeba) TaxID=382638 RepID=Q17V67_HELAH|nr:hypothetical protein [Helicobacter acinonychis]CAK00459.1 amino acid permease fragment 1 [Helicobacter acinonychis str. Sheeba]
MGTIGIGLFVGARGNSASVGHLAMLLAYLIGGLSFILLFYFWGN